MWQERRLCTNKESLSGLVLGLMRVRDAPGSCLGDLSGWYALCEVGILQELRQTAGGEGELSTGNEWLFHQRGQLPGAGFLASEAVSVASHVRSVTPTPLHQAQAQGLLTTQGFMVGGTWAPSSMKLRKRETSYIDIQFTTNMSTHGQHSGEMFIFKKYVNALGVLVSEGCLLGIQIRTSLVNSDGFFLFILNCAKNWASGIDLYCVREENVRVSCLPGSLLFKSELKSNLLAYPERTWKCPSPEGRTEETLNEALNVTQSWHLLSDCHSTVNQGQPLIRRHRFKRPSHPLKMTPQIVNQFRT
ncbi:Ankyrin Repeat And Death Domain-Containing Protein 1A [Manis pentadactyla]|nr:Ankyrin Repeat And Death Domain-Containing Protein 1A [Manis pentadactyla]